MKFSSPSPDGRAESDAGKASRRGRSEHSLRRLTRCSRNLGASRQPYSVPPAPPVGDPPCRPGGAGAAAGAGSRVRSPAKQRTSGGTYLRRRRLSSPRTSHRPASGARAGSSGLRAAAGGSGYGELPGRARGVPAAGMVRRRRPPGARGGRVGAARGREGEGASAPAAVAVALPLPAPARSCGSGIGFRDRVIRSLLTHRP